MVFIYFQNKKMMEKEEKLYRLATRNRKAVLKRLLKVSLYGIVGGFAGSLIFVLLGVTLGDVGIGYLWLVALLAMLIKMRFMCFSYAGGIISLSSLLFGWPDINVPSILIIVAVLHFMESILIRLNGYERPLPLSLKGKEGKAYGVFLLQKMWPLPFVAMIVLAVSNGALLEGSVLDMPGWWPLIESTVQAEPQKTVMYFLIPVAAGLGYGDLAAARTPRKKAAQTSSDLLLYSLVLLGLALGGAYFPPLLFGAALFSPIGHEYVIKQGQKSIKKEQAVYQPPDSGVLILDVYSGGQAERKGLNRGDIVTAVNGTGVNNYWEFWHNFNGQRVSLELLSGEIIRLETQAQTPGLVVLNDQPQREFNQLTKGQSILNQLFNKIKGGI